MNQQTVNKAPSDQEGAAEVRTEEWKARALEHDLELQPKETPNWKQRRAEKVSLKLLHNFETKTGQFR